MLAAIVATLVVAVTGLIILARSQPTPADRTVTFAHTGSRYESIRFAAGQADYRLAVRLEANTAFELDQIIDPPAGYTVGAAPDGHVGSYRSNGGPISDGPLDLFATRVGGTVVVTVHRVHPAGGDTFALRMTDCSALLTGTGFCQTM